MVNIVELVGLDINIPTWILIIVGLFIPYYIQYTWNFHTFDKLGIPCVKPWIPFAFLIPLIRDGMTKVTKSCYKEAKKTKVLGTFESQPVLIVTDLDMMREIYVKQFHCFENRPKILSGFLIDRFVSLLEGEHWKHTRNIISPTFSMSKLKDMTNSLNECADELLEKFNEIFESEGDFHPSETVQLFTYDAIARSAFGLNIHAMKEPNSEFVTEGKKLINSFTAKNPLFLLTLFLPMFRKLLEFSYISLVSKSVIVFFRSVIEGTVKEREAANMKQSDFLQQLLSHRVDPKAEEKAKGGDLQNGDFKIGSAGLWSTKGFTDDDIIAQGLLFLFAGFDTVANSLAVALYCLAINSECQNNLVKEIEEVIGDKDIIEYNDVVYNMPYLDSCINESMRMYPPAFRIDRICTEGCVIEGVKIPKGMSVSIPVVGIHHDEEYWKNPEIFDPERFSNDEKANRNPYVFQPFGHGPRNCIGMRLALMKVKIALVKVLRKFEMVPTEKTKIPLPMKGFSAKEEPGLIFKVQKRA